MGISKSSGSSSLGGFSQADTELLISPSAAAGWCTAGCQGVKDWARCRRSGHDREQALRLDFALSQASHNCTWQSQDSAAGLPPLPGAAAVPPPSVPLTWWLQQASDALILLCTRLSAPSGRPQRPGLNAQAKRPARQTKSSSSGATCRCLRLLQRGGQIGQRHTLHSGPSELVGRGGVSVGHDEPNPCALATVNTAPPRSNCRGDCFRTGWSAGCCAAT